MSIKPAGSSITVNGQTLIVDSINGPVVDVLFFERLEYSHQRQREVANADGSFPIFFELLGGQKVQYNNTGCNPNDTIRDLTPDDSDYDNIYRRFDIIRWEVRGASSVAANVESVLLNVARPHKILLDMFEAYRVSQRANISIGFLLGLKTIGLGIINNLTTTSVTVTGMPLGTGTLVTLTNTLMTNFSMSPEYEEPANEAGTSSIILRSWGATIEQRTHTSARSEIW